MRFVAGSQLVRRSETELDALLLGFNQALARSRPFSEEWKDARLSADNILSERMRIVYRGPGCIFRIRGISPNS